MFLSKQAHTSRLQHRIAVSVFFFISGFTFSSWASRIPSMQQQYHLNDARLGTVLFIMPLGLIVTLPFTGLLINKVSSRVLMLWGALLYVLLLPLIPAAGKVWQLSFVLFIFGASRNFLNVSANAQSVSVQAMYDKYIFASFHGLWSLAGFAGATLGSFMTTHNISTATHFYIVSATTLILILFSFSHTVKETTKQQEKKPLIVLPDKRLVKLGVIAFCSMCCEGTMYDWSGVYFQKAVHAQASQVGWGFVAYMGTMTTARFTCGRLVDRYGVIPVLQVSGCLITAGLLTAVTLPTMASALTGFALTGLGVSFVVPLILSISGRNSNMPVGSALAAVSIISYLGFLLAPPVIGYIAELFSLRISFLLMAAFGLMIALLASKIKKAHAL